MRTKTRLKHAAIHIIGWSFIALGILGLFLPILQGILFLLVGLFVLSSVSPWAERLLHKLRKRFPKISKSFDEAKSKASTVQTRIASRFDEAKSKIRTAHASVFKRKSGRHTL
jgi:uncharacterized membrane protein YbaN (DUF454 family)